MFKFQDLNLPTFLQVKYSDSLFGSGKPFKILHSFLNETESGEILDLSVLLIRVQAIGIFAALLKHLKYFS